MTTARRVAAEGIGALLLAAAVVGSGVMAERPADVPGFVGAQFGGALVAFLLSKWLYAPRLKP